MVGLQREGTGGRKRESIKNRNICRISLGSWCNVYPGVLVLGESASQLNCKYLHDEFVLPIHVTIFSFGS